MVLVAGRQELAAVPHDSVAAAASWVEIVVVAAVAAASWVETVPAKLNLWVRRSQTGTDRAGFGNSPPTPRWGILIQHKWHAVEEAASGWSPVDLGSPVPAAKRSLGDASSFPVAPVAAALVAAARLLAVPIVAAVAAATWSTDSASSSPDAPLH